jgi:hypothetical protein
MLRFHTSVHGGTSKTEALGVSFDHAVDALQKFDRMFIEPDGSFVWTGCTQEGQSWQLDGYLIDRGDFLACVELKGQCPEAQLDMLLTVLGWPKQMLAFQLTTRGVFLSDEEFRALAASEGGAI